MLHFKPQKSYVLVRIYLSMQSRPYLLILDFIKQHIRVEVCCYGFWFLCFISQVIFCPVILGDSKQGFFAVLRSHLKGPDDERLERET